MDAQRLKLKRLSTKDLFQKFKSSNHITSEGFTKQQLAEELMGRVGEDEDPKNVVIKLALARFYKPPTEFFAKFKDDQERFLDLTKAVADTPITPATTREEMEVILVANLNWVTYFYENRYGVQTRPGTQKREGEDSLRKLDIYLGVFGDKELIKIFKGIVGKVLEKETKSQVAPAARLVLDRGTFEALKPLPIGKLLHFDLEMQALELLEDPRDSLKITAKLSELSVLAEELKKQKEVDVKLKIMKFYQKAYYCRGLPIFIRENFDKELVAITQELARTKIRRLSDDERRGVLRAKIELAKYYFLGSHLGLAQDIKKGKKLMEEVVDLLGKSEARGFFTDVNNDRVKLYKELDVILIAHELWRDVEEIGRLLEPLAIDKSNEAAQIRVGFDNLKETAHRFIFKTEDPARMNLEELARDFSVCKVDMNALNAFLEQRLKIGNFTEAQKNIFVRAYNFLKYCLVRLNRNWAPRFRLSAARSLEIAHLRAQERNVQLARIKNLEKGTVSRKLISFRQLGGEGRQRDSGSDARGRRKADAPRPT